VKAGGSGSLGSNIGLGFSSGNNGQYGLNLFGGKNAAFSGNAALNLGAYQGGYRNPFGGQNNFGFPKPNANFGFPNFGNPMHG